MTVAYGKGAVAKATKLHSKIVRARGHCERCGGTDCLQAAHIVRRTYAWTRTDTMNAWCLCAACHFKVDNDARAFMLLVDRTIGRDFLDGLHLKAEQGVRVKFVWPDEVARLQSLWDAIQEAA